ncbi:MAG: site-2 protease family protein [Phaeodactylibacter sp.]|nr:site-2 protease family protein [Phaeodactylibacter sp.]MCB9272599.1 site-2 protease family protein [Lewinellaceae bacterium]
MKGVFQVAKLFGIPVQIHWSFLLIFAWVFYVGSEESLDWWEMGAYALLVMALFLCVVLHEFGHALTARRYGVETRDIILSPIGGIARLDRLPEKPWQEFMVAIAGPLVNVAISAALAVVPMLSSGENRRQFYHYFYALFYPDSNTFTLNVSPVYEFLFLLIIVNIVLALFNMLPAFPMDGGRVLRALLSTRLGRLKATRIAAYIGQGFAVLLAGYGIWSVSPITALIGVFVFMAAASEYRMAKMEGLLDYFTIGDVARRQFTRLYAADPVDTALDQYRQGMEKDFLVFDEWQNLMGVLPEKELIAVANGGAENSRLSIGQLVSSGYEALLVSDPLKAVLPGMQWKHFQLLPVFDKGKLVGVVDQNAVNSFIRLQRKPGWRK